MTTFGPKTYYHQYPSGRGGGIEHQRSGEVSREVWVPFEGAHPGYVDYPGRRDDRTLVVGLDLSDAHRGDLVIDDNSVEAMAHMIDGDSGHYGGRTSGGWNGREINRFRRPPLRIHIVDIDHGDRILAEIPFSLPEVDGALGGRFRAEYGVHQRDWEDAIRDKAIQCLIYEQQGVNVTVTEPVDTPAPETERKGGSETTPKVETGRATPAAGGSTGPRRRPGHRPEVDMPSLAVDEDTSYAGEFGNILATTRTDLSILERTRQTRDELEQVKSELFDPEFGNELEGSGDLRQRAVSIELGVYAAKEAVKNPSGNYLNNGRIQGLPIPSTVNGIEIDEKAMHEGVVDYYLDRQFDNDGEVAENEVPLADHLSLTLLGALEKMDETEELVYLQDLSTHLSSLANFHAMLKDNYEEHDKGQLQLLEFVFKNDPQAIDRVRRVTSATLAERMPEFVDSPEANRAFQHNLISNINPDPSVSATWGETGVSGAWERGGGAWLKNTIGNIPPLLLMVGIGVGSWLLLRKKKEDGSTDLWGTVKRIAGILLVGNIASYAVSRKGMFSYIRDVAYTGRLIDPAAQPGFDRWVGDNAFTGIGLSSRRYGIDKTRNILAQTGGVELNDEAVLSDDNKEGQANLAYEVMQSMPLHLLRSDPDFSWVNDGLKNETISSSDPLASQKALLQWVLKADDSVDAGDIRDNLIQGRGHLLTRLVPAGGPDGGYLSNEDVYHDRITTYGRGEDNMTFGQKYLQLLEARLRDEKTAATTPTPPSGSGAAPTGSGSGTP